MSHKQKRGRQDTSPAGGAEETTPRLTLTLKIPPKVEGGEKEHKSSDARPAQALGRSKRAHVLKNVMDDFEYYNKVVNGPAAAESPTGTAVTPEPKSRATPPPSHERKKSSPDSHGDELRHSSRKRKSTLDTADFEIPNKIKKLNADPADQKPDRKSHKGDHKKKKHDHHATVVNGAEDVTYEEGSAEHEPKRNGAEAREKHRHHREDRHEHRHSKEDRHRHKGDRHSKDDRHSKSDKQHSSASTAPGQDTNGPKLKLKLRIKPPQEAANEEEGIDAVQSEAAATEAPVAEQPKVRVKVKLPPRSAEQEVKPNGMDHSGSVVRKEGPVKVVIRKDGNAPVRRDGIPPVKIRDGSTPEKREGATPARTPTLVRRDGTTPVKRDGGITPVKTRDGSTPVKTRDGSTPARTPTQKGDIATPDATKKRTHKPNEYDKQVITKVLGKGEAVPLEKRIPKPKVFMEDGEDDTPRRERKQSDVKPQPPLDDAEANLRKTLQNVLNQAIKFDKSRTFMNPVTEAIAPGYFSVIHKPMDFKTMQKKLKGGEYHSLKALQDDFDLIVNNCCTYNPQTSVFYRMAKKLQTYCRAQVASAGSDLKDEKEAAPKIHAKPETPKIEPGRDKNQRLAKPIAPPKPTPQLPSLSSASSRPSTSTPFSPPPSAKPQTPFPLSNKSASFSGGVQYSPVAIGFNTSISQLAMQNPLPIRPPQVSGTRPGQRPPVVELTGNQTTQTQSLHSEQPKRKYVKVNNDEAAKPSAASRKPPAVVHTAKIGTTPLVSPMNAPGSFVYSMYLPRFTEETPTPPSAIPATRTPRPLPASTLTTTPKRPSLPEIEPMDIDTPNSNSKKQSDDDMSIPPPPSPSSITPVTLQPNYRDNYVSIPILHQPRPLHATPKQPTKQSAEESDAIFTKYLYKFVDAIDFKGRAQVTEFMQMLQNPEKSQFHLVDKRDLRRVSSNPSTPAAGPTFPTPSDKQPMETDQPHPTPTTPPTTTTTKPTPKTIGDLIGDISPDLMEEINAIDNTEITPEELQELRALQDLAGINLDFLEPLLKTTTTKPTIPTATTQQPLSPSVATPPLSEEAMDFELTTTTTNPTATETTTTTQESQGTLVVATEIEKTTSQQTQSILDRNFEILVNLQLLQYERPISAPSDSEYALASELSSNLIDLASTLRPNQLVSKEAIYNTLHASGLQSMSTSTRRS